MEKIQFISFDDLKQQAIDGKLPNTYDYLLCFKGNLDTLEYLQTNYPLIKYDVWEEDGLGEAHSIQFRIVGVIFPVVFKQLIHSPIRSIDIQYPVNSEDRVLALEKSLEIFNINRSDVIWTHHEYVPQPF
jgi:hypothetical protein